MYAFTSRCWSLRTTMYRMGLHMYRKVLSRSRPYCNLTVEKGDEHTKFCFGSLRKFLFANTLFKKSEEEKKQNKKAKSTAFGGQRETTRHEEKQSMSRDKLCMFFQVFCCSSNAPVPWFCFRTCASCVRTLFFGGGISPQMKALIFISVHIVFGWSSIHVFSSSNFPRIRVVP